MPPSEEVRPFWLTDFNSLKISAPNIRKDSNSYQVFPLKLSIYIPLANLKLAISTPIQFSSVFPKGSLSHQMYFSNHLPMYLQFGFDASQNQCLSPSSAQRNGSWDSIEILWLLSETDPSLTGRKIRQESGLDTWRCPHRLQLEIVAWQNTF